MTDVVDAKTRSRMMSGIKGRDTKPEVALRRALHALGFRYRLYSAKLPGRPDMVFPMYRAVVFVHGCFWHRHRGCRYTTTPATNTGFWMAKFAATMTRDERIVGALVSLGWRVATVWECSLKEAGAAEIALDVAAWLRSDQHLLELPSGLETAIRTDTADKTGVKTG